MTLHVAPWARILSDGRAVEHISPQGLWVAELPLSSGPLQHADSVMELPCGRTGLRLISSAVQDVLGEARVALGMCVGLQQAMHTVADLHSHGRE